MPIKYDGQFIIGNPGRGSVNRRIYLKGFTEFLPTQIIKATLKKGMTFVDIGANHGYFSFIAAKRVQQTGRVIAFEPIPSAIKNLKEGINYNAYRNIEVHEIALSNTNKVIHMDLDKFKIVANNKGNIIDIKCYSLDDYSENMNLSRVDLIKMDIEGHEFEALEGMKKTLRLFKPILLVEVHPKLLLDRKVDVADLFNLLQDLNYIIDPIDISNSEFNNILSKGGDCNFHILASVKK